MSFDFRLRPKSCHVVTKSSEIAFLLCGWPIIWTLKLFGLSSTKLSGPILSGTCCQPICLLIRMVVFLLFWVWYLWRVSSRGTLWGTSIQTRQRMSEDNSHLSTALQNGGACPPHTLSAHNVPGHVNLSIHKAPLLEGDVIVQVRFDGRTFLGHDLGLDGSDLLHGHGLRERPVELLGAYETILKRVILHHYHFAWQLILT